MTRKKKSKNYLALGIKYIFVGIYWVFKNIFLGLYWIMEHLYKEIRQALSRKPKLIHQEVNEELPKEIKPAEVSKKQKSISNPAFYESFKTLEDIKEAYPAFEEKLFEEGSTIGIILGARGTGKSALGLKLLENIHAQTERKVYTMGFKNTDLPAWITNITAIEEVDNGAVLLADESGIQFSSRESMSNVNKLLSNLLLIARHKDLSLLFITQNCLPLNEKILTPRGIKTLKEFKDKELVYAFNFDTKRLVQVQARKFPTAKKKLVKIYLEDGRILKCSPDHKWFVSNSGKITEKKAKDLKTANDYLIDVSNENTKL
ncbi:MAG: zonular occludens toxin domain-containing protein [Candidatus Nanoarchaeia archaeon]